MVYGITDWQIDLFIRTRDFIKLQAHIDGSKKVLDEARKLCDEYTYIINGWNGNADVYDFDEPI